jgi:hypothetical protein
MNKLKTYNDFLNEKNSVNESITDPNFLEMYLMWVIVNQYKDLPRSQWLQSLSQNFKELFIDFMSVLKQFGYSYDEDVLRYKFDSLLKNVIEKLGLGKWEEGGIELDK